jgi:hypothetical protein
MPVSKTRKKTKKRRASGWSSDDKKLLAQVEEHYHFFDVMRLFFAVEEIQKTSGESKEVILERIRDRAMSKMLGMSSAQIRDIKSEIFCEELITVFESIEKLKGERKCQLP